MYRTRIFLIWLSIGAAEFAFIFIATWLSLYVPKKFKKDFKEGLFDEYKQPVQAIRQRFYLNWPFASLFVALATVIVFAILHYGEIIRVGFDGLWFGHLMLVFLLLMSYMFLSFALIIATLMGEGGREIYLKNLYYKKYRIVIE